MPKEKLLRFKGDPKTKKKKKIKKESAEKQNWNLLQEKEEFKGLFALSWQGKLLNYLSLAQKLSFKPVEEEQVTENESGTAVGAPVVGTQVFQCVPMEDKIYIKCSMDKYFTVRNDKLECDNEACGLLEGFTLEKVDGGWILKNFNEKYCDWSSFSFVDSPNPHCTFAIYAKEIKEKIKVFKSAAELEMEALEKYHSVAKTVGKELLELKDPHGLTDARKQGKLNEYMIERRTKFKGDKFCW
jgi:hypothetical protein